MPAISSLRSQRLSELRTDIGQQYVAFRMRLAWFILPVKSIYRVIPLEKTIPKLTVVGQNVPIVDLGKLLFAQTQTAANTVQPLIVNGARVVSKPCLVVVRSQTDDLVGILSNSQPALQKILQDDLVPLPQTYVQRWKVDFITSMTIPSKERPSLFAIDSDRLASKILHTK
ncbi:MULTISPECIES: chemotaxis protein CheW [Pseudanabaena]|uniref:CheW domain protein n=2 Tax=Pseudanabaena TaxID=1152 RepID=L8N332_9CYAN|nr:MULTISPECIES: chemotaxis protein CheW [Pseudanabaena]ELS33130.1 CheW domain protein [Pseudanabaena biceps PCC 7429]MDG3494652.1 chemotaxis protein CheW [Pseudanabaena catenata USMAC16]